MENGDAKDRRKFLVTAALGTAALVLPAARAHAGKKKEKGIFKCKVCSHLEFGRAPEICPVCFSGREKFVRDDNIFADAEKQYPETAAKHTPAITVKKKCGLVPEASCTDIVVRIGKTLHPMEAGHHITFVDCYADGKYISRALLTPGVNPAACFHLKAKARRVRIVELCNLHGYWQAEAAAG